MMGPAGTISLTHLWLTVIFLICKPCNNGAYLGKTIAHKNDNIFSHLLSIPVPVKSPDIRGITAPIHGKFGVPHRTYSYQLPQGRFNPAIWDNYSPYPNIYQNPVGSEHFSSDFPEWRKQSRYPESDYRVQLYGPYIRYPSSKSHKVHSTEENEKKEDWESSTYFDDIFSKSPSIDTPQGKGARSFFTTQPMTEEVLEMPPNILPTEPVVTESQEQERANFGPATRSYQPEYFYNPNSPYFFVGGYPGTTKKNNTLIVLKKPFKMDEEKPPTVRKLSSKMVFIGDQLTPFDVEKNSITDFLSNFPKPGWCLSEVDNDDIQKCCEEHERCAHTIESGERNYGLKNTGPYRRLHCSCENEFYNCLKKTSGVISNSLGVAYFNILAPKCFAFEHKIKCLSKNKWKKCVKYGYDQNSERRYEWLDTQTY